MSAITFDTLKFANRLKAAGAEPKLAEAEAEAIAEALADVLRQTPTAEELRRIEGQTASRADVKETEAALRLEIERLRTETQKTIGEAKTDTLKWGAGMLLAQAGLIAALVKLL